ncbi:metallothionein-like protein 1 [Diospyros lotus]|uniref:metallothionein-like protein 1 n=1 Tax=Diospyros lotus TaxID=55363 RepID=UPI00225390E7|nr:metallothionein-like protein 1 [Diospyros lotus]
MSSCGCGSSCQCGSSCGGGCGMYPDVEKSTATAITIGGVAPPVKTYSEGSEKSTGTEAGHGCKCGSNCTCDPCNC